MPETADPALLERAVKGDTAALADLLRRHGPDAQRGLHIDARWRSMVDPEDVMQVTYLEAFLQIDRFDPAKPQAFGSWLARIAENNLRDAIRGMDRLKQPRPEKRVDLSVGACDSCADLLAQLWTDSGTPSRAAAANEARAIIDSAIVQLPRDYAQVVTLYDLEGKSISETAAALGRTAGAVHMLRARAHDRLREILGRESVFFTRSA